MMSSIGVRTNALMPIYEDDRGLTMDDKDKGMMPGRNGGKLQVGGGKRNRDDGDGSVPELPKERRQGNPNMIRFSEFRRAVEGAFTKDDVVAVITKMGEFAKAGDPMAAKVYLERTVGKVSDEVDSGEEIGIQEGMDASGVRDTIARVVSAYDREAITGKRMERLLNGLDHLGDAIQVSVLEEQLAQLKAEIARINSERTGVAE